LNTSVDAKSAKKKYQGRKEEKEDFFFPLCSLRSSSAFFASTLVFNNPAKAVLHKDLPSMGGFRCGACLNASVGAKDAKKKYQGRKGIRKLFLSLRSWLFSFAPFASTLVFNNPAKALMS